MECCSCMILTGLATLGCQRLKSNWLNGRQRPTSSPSLPRPLCNAQNSTAMHCNQNAIHSPALHLTRMQLKSKLGWTELRWYALKCVAALYFYCTVKEARVTDSSKRCSRVGWPWHSNFSLLIPKIREWINHSLLSAWKIYLFDHKRTYLVCSIIHKTKFPDWRAGKRGWYIEQDGFVRGA